MAGRKAPRPRLNPRDFQALLEGYLARLASLRYSRTTIVTLRLGLPRFLRHLKREGVRDVRAVSERHVTSYARRLATVHTRWRRPFTVNSRRAALSMVRRFFAFLLKEGVILRDPSREVPMPHAHRLPRPVLTETQARRLMAAPDRYTVSGLRDRALLETLYGSGLRARECRRLDLADLDLSRMILWVRDGKGRKDRLAPLSGRAAIALSSYLSDGRPQLLKHPREQALFLARYGRRISASFLQDIVVRMAQRAGLPLRVSPHALRHACATHLLQGGADIRHVQEILGHRSIQTTALYTKVLVKDLAKVIERSHPRARG